MHKLLSLLFFFLAFQLHIVEGQISNYKEKDIADYIHTLIGGEREVSVESGRIDLVHQKIAFEIEWADNWKEAVGQSLWYGLQSNLQPGIILIMRNKEDYKYSVMLGTTLEYAGLSDKVKVYIFPNDFTELIEKAKGK